MLCERAEGENERRAERCLRKALIGKHKWTGRLAKAQPAAHWSPQAAFSLAMLLRVVVLCAVLSQCAVAYLRCGPVRSQQGRIHSVTTVENIARRFEPASAER